MLHHAAVYRSANARSSSIVRVKVSPKRDGLPQQLLHRLADIWIICRWSVVYKLKGRAEAKSLKSASLKLDATKQALLVDIEDDLAAVRAHSRLTPKP
jgi:hypothetical protein